MASGERWFDMELLNVVLDLGPMAAATFLAVATSVRGEPPVARIGTVAAKVGCHPETARLAIVELAKAGAVDYTPGRGRRALAIIRPGNTNRNTHPSMGFSENTQRNTRRNTHASMGFSPCHAVPGSKTDLIDLIDRSARAREETGPDGRTEPDLAAFERDWRAMLADGAWRPSWRPKAPEAFVAAAARGCVEGDARYLAAWRAWQSSHGNGNGGCPPGGRTAVVVGTGRATPEESAEYVERRARRAGYVHASEQAMPEAARALFAAARQGRNGNGAGER